MRRWLAEWEGRLQQEALEDVPDVPDSAGVLRRQEPGEPVPPTRAQVVVEHLLAAARVLGFFRLRRRPSRAL